MAHPCYPETIGADLSLREISPGHQVAADPCCLSAEDWETLQQRKTGPHNPF
jgi:peptide/nickel transport system ATP-binding protein/oligopeptide transport system ATP-binding protein